MIAEGSDLIQAARFSPDGRRVLTGSVNGVLAEWDSKSARRLRLLLDPAGNEDPPVAPRAGAFGEGAPPPGADILEAVRGGSIMAVVWFPDGRRFAAAAANGWAAVWDAGSGRALCAWEADATAVVVIEVSPDGRWLATGSCETGTTTLRVWRIGESWADPPIEAFSSDRMIGGVFSLAFSSDNRYLASGGWGFSGYSAPMIYDVATGERVNTLLWDASRAIRFSPEGRRLATGDEFGKVSIWDLDTRSRIMEKTAHGGIVSLVLFSSDGRSLLSGSCDGGLKLWDAASGELRIEQTFDGLVLDGRFEGDGRSATVVTGVRGEERPQIHHVRF
ncbi:MAG TPA: WD40 repeat domain-containing protein [Acidobacteriota bacterium]|nr:WD40 repeat domain-containing protein [Acidobacteriota bacterium]HQF87989.1 WD40 repeat domain-containing protein [Acidobacteriota bacterium]HQG92201.1 WD40 repeat domain-containing protein [Acidobacteriota bacterium]